MSHRAIIARLDGCAAGFNRHVVSADNLFARESPHAIFAAFSDYVRMADTVVAWPEVARYVNGIVDDAGGEFDNAVCSCFLENLAERDHPLERHLTGPARRYWDCWT